MTPETPTPANVEFLTVNEVAARLRVSPRSLQRWRARDEFPSPVRIGRQKLGWPPAQIEEWARNRPLVDC